MIKPELIETLRDNPKCLYDLSPREFEEMIAELLASSGCDVSLSPDITPHAISRRYIYIERSDPRV